MKIMNMPLLILMVFSAATFNGHALAMNLDDNTSSIEVTSDPFDTQIDTFEVDENANVVNITENSNESILVEKIIEEQKKPSTVFSLDGSMVSPLIAIILFISIVYIRRKT